MVLESGFSSTEITSQVVFIDVIDGEYGRVNLAVRLQDEAFIIFVIINGEDFTSAGFLCWNQECKIFHII